MYKAVARSVSAWETLQQRTDFLRDGIGGMGDRGAENRRRSGKGAPLSMRALGRDGLRGGFEFNDKTPRGTGYREGVWREPQWLWVETGGGMDRAFGHDGTSSCLHCQCISFSHPQLFKASFSHLL